VTDDPLAGALEQIQRAGLVPPERDKIIIDGRPHGFAGRPGKRKKSSWYLLREQRDRHGRDYLVGAFGDRALDDFKQRIDPTHPLEPEDLAAARRAIAKARRVAEQQRQRLAARAAQRAARAWARLRPADPGSAPYLRRKGVGAHGGARVTPRGALALPAYGPGGGLVALEFIHAAPRLVDGEARARDFWPWGCSLKGASFRLGPEPGTEAAAPPLVLVEGYATGASCYEATGWPVLVCFSAGNLEEVARQHAGRGPGRVLIAGDDDYQTEGNPGAAAARRAAKIVDGCYVLPRFAARPEGTQWTDWNDLHAAEGLMVVRAQLEAARAGPDAPAGDDGPPAGDEAAADWRRQLRKTKGGELLPCVANIVRIFERERVWRGVLAWCDFSHRIVKRAPPPWGGRLGEWTESDDAHARWWLSDRYALDVGRQDLEAALTVCAESHHVHPVREYLSGLHWDGENRLPTWLADYCGAEENDYAARIGTLWLISAVARVMQPPVKVDCVLILEGEMGRGKSGALGILGGEWFSDTPIYLHDKDAMQNLAGVWILELPELETFQNARPALLNSFFSRAVDHYRQSYAHRAGDYVRQCVFAGTSNPVSYLSDPNGARRFWPVSCAGAFRLDRLRADRNQLWAEAFCRWQCGEQWWPSAADAERFGDEQELRYIEDPWEEIIDRYLFEPERRLQQYISIAELLTDALGFDSPHMQGRESQRVGAVMKRLGWIKQRRTVTLDGMPKRCSIYRRPDSEGTSTLDDDSTEPMAAGAAGHGQGRKPH
jgi:putative DNA primase/helicase